MQRRAEQSVLRLEELQSEISALATLPEATAVTAAVDPEGRLTRLTIDREARKDLTDEQLAYELHLAIAHAYGERDAPAPPRPDAGLDVAGLLDRIFSGAEAAAVAPQPELVWNDRRTVGMSAVWGVIQDVRVDQDWLGASSELTIETDVLAWAAEVWERSVAAQSAGED
jgi:hypothetical protein